MNLIPIRRALLSVSDKSGIVEFARQLQRWHIDIISTGGTLATLRDAGIEARSVTDVTGFPEILDGRVKTLHPAIHAGLLARTDHPAHVQQIKELGIQSIDLVVVNLYPFQQTIAKPRCRKPCISDRTSETNRRAKCPAHCGCHEKKQK